MDLHTFNKLYKDYYHKSILFTKSFVYDDSVAEDIVADTFMKLLESMNEREIECGEAFLVTMLKNKSLDYLRHQSLHIETLDKLQSIGVREIELRISSLNSCDPEEIFSKEIKSIIEKTIRTLPEQTREIFILSRFQNKSNAEIAQRMNLSTKAIEYHITKALKPLRIALKDYLPMIFL